MMGRRVIESSKRWNEDSAETKEKKKEKKSDEMV